MKRQGLAKRYARALFDLAGSAPEAVKLSQELTSFTEAVRHIPDLQQVLYNPFFLTQRRKVVEGVARELVLAPQTLKSLLYLVERDRVRQLSDIAEAMLALAEARAGKLRAQVSTTVELPEDRYARIRAALERITGRTIVIEKVIEPGLIGGVAARVGSVVYDLSVATLLGRFKSAYAKER